MSQPGLMVPFVAMGLGLDETLTFSLPYGQVDARIQEPLSNPESCGNGTVATGDVGALPFARAPRIWLLVLGIWDLNTVGFESRRRNRLASD